MLQGRGGQRKLAQKDQALPHVQVRVDVGQAQPEGAPVAVQGLVVVGLRVLRLGQREVKARARRLVPQQELHQTRGVLVQPVAVVAQRQAVQRVEDGGIDADGRAGVC